MKLICIVPCISILLAGCYSQAPITRDGFAPDDSKVFFYLQDGSYIKSFSGNHHRIDTGYQISGEMLRTKQFPKKFEGVVADAEIADVTVERINILGTVLGCVLGGTLIAYPVGSIRW